jgi:hypothetical protein
MFNNIDLEKIFRLFLKFLKIRKGGDSLWKIKFLFLFSIINLFLISVIMLAHFFISFIETITNTLYESYIYIEGMFFIIWGIKRHIFVKFLYEVWIMYGEEWEDLVGPFSRSHLFIEIPFVLFMTYCLMWDTIEEDIESMEEDQFFLEEDPQAKETVEINRNLLIKEDLDDATDFISVYHMESELEEEEIIWECRERYNQVYYDLPSFFSYKIVYPVLRFFSIILPSYMTEMVTSNKDPFYYITLFLRSILYVPVSFLVVFERIFKKSSLYLVTYRKAFILMFLEKKYSLDFLEIIMLLLISLEIGIFSTFIYHMLAEPKFFFMLLKFNQVLVSCL